MSETLNIKKGRPIEKVILSNSVYAVCTCCHKLKPISAFGLRNMGTGEVRNQAQCRKCRVKYK